MYVPRSQALLIHVRGVKPGSDYSSFMYVHMNLYLTWTFLASRLSQTRVVENTWRFELALSITTVDVHVCKTKPNPGFGRIVETSIFEQRIQYDREMSTCKLVNALILVYV